MIRKFISFLFIFGVIGAAVFVCFKIFGKETKSISTFEFVVGGLDENGEYEKNEQTLVTKDMFECNGLDVELNEDSALSYQIYYYNIDKEFIKAGAVHSKSYTSDSKAVTAAKYARIVISPELPDGEDPETWKIGYFEKFAIASKLKIKVDKDQTTRNLCVKDKAGKSYAYNTTTNKYTVTTKENVSIAKEINIENMQSFRVYNSTDDDIIVYLMGSTSAEKSFTLKPGEQRDFTREEFKSYTYLGISYKTSNKLPKVYMLK